MIKLFDKLKKIKSSLRNRYRIFKDNFEVIMKLRHPLEPPKRYNYINIGTNDVIGNEFLKYFIELGNLKKDYKVLEVGSGFGRMALPLTKYLNENGSYYGLEIIKDGYNWCNSKFTSKFSNFKFKRIDVINERYNPSGTIEPSNYKFPFSDGSFDFVILTSVFTHMYPKDIQHYLYEISRVLKKGGNCFITYYLINEVSLKNIEKQLGVYNFRYFEDNYRFEDKENQLYQIAFDEKSIRKYYKKSEIEIKEPIHFGSWSGRDDYLSFQDIVVGTKT